MSESEIKPTIPTWALVAVTGVLAFVAGVAFVAFRGDWAGGSSERTFSGREEAEGRGPVRGSAGRRRRPAAARRWAAGLTRERALRLYADAADVALKHHVRKMSLREFLCRGLDALRESAVAPADAQEFSGLRDAERRTAWVEAIAAARRECENAADPPAGRSPAAGEGPTHADAIKRLQALLDASAGSVGLPPGLVVYECLAGGLDALGSGCRLLVGADLRERDVRYAGRFAGVGIEWTMKQGIPTVDLVYPRGPAWEAGVRRGDRILSVDRKGSTGASVQEVAKRLRGERGTTVALEVGRPDQPGVADAQMVTFRFNIKRRIVEVPTVAGAELLDPTAGVAYLRLRRFQKKTTVTVIRELRRLKREGMRGLILDLRGSSGARLLSAAAVADLFLARGKIVESRWRDPANNKMIRSRHYTLYAEMPMAVLIDGRTRAGGEILAGALKENKRATLFGARTAGTASLQRVFQLKPHGVALELPVCLFRTPSGTPIEAAGIAPDVLVGRESEAPPGPEALRAGGGAAGGEGYGSACSFEDAPVVNAALGFLRMKLPRVKAGASGK